MTHVSLILALSDGPLKVPLVRGKNVVLFGNSIATSLVEEIDRPVRLLLEDACKHSLDVLKEAKPYA